MPLEMLLARVDLVAAGKATSITPGRALATGALVGGGRARDSMSLSQMLLLLLLLVVVVRVGHSDWRRSAAPCMIERPFEGGEEERE
jgi:hypothetical protein